MNIPKYRAWHKEYKSMKPALEMDFDPDKEVFVESKQPEYDDGKYRMYGEYWFWREIELMQFTGLQDKSKKDIYAKDIIHTRENSGWVEWDNTKGMWIVQSFAWWCELCNTVEPEAIGNIYQHPELLEQQP